MASPEDPFDDFVDTLKDSYVLVEVRPQRIEYFDDEDEVDDNFPDRDEERPTGFSPARRWLLIIVTLLIITALVATTILPGLLAAHYNNARQMLPPPTVLPRV